ncbi:NmrA/HSCARG family protein [Nonomuraea sp. NPDC050663]|uniref:NmrA/HSCARG family protein n=1 Tax=Nonomuraea sp. NPDC050663 TaxID=3364370 RepID=UPI003788743A
MSKPVLVIGATGQQGGAAARQLLRRDKPVRAFVRDPEAPAARALREAGASLVRGDLDDTESVRAALDGASGVFLALTMMTGPRITAEGVAAEERRGKLVVDLAAQSGVDHLVYSSLAGVDEPTGIPYYESKGRIEAHIRASGLRFTMVRPGSFMENFTTLTRPVVTGDEIVVNLAIRPTKPMNLIAVDDIGVFAARALTFSTEYAGESIELAGDRLTGEQIAEAFGRATGLPARFQQVPIERLRAFDPEVARTFEWMDTRETPPPDIDGLRALHPGLLTLETWLKGWTR